jgi:hypothetical protein
LKPDGTIATLIWVDIFKNDFHQHVNDQGLAVLSEETLPNVRNGLLEVRSKEMHTALCSLFPNRLDHRKEQQALLEHHPQHPKSLIHIPLRRKWFDALDGHLPKPEENRYVFDHFINLVAYAGHLEYIQHLVEWGYLVLFNGRMVSSWDIDEGDFGSLPWAIQSGRLELVRYLIIDQGCVVDGLCIIHTASNGHLHIIESLLHPNRYRELYTSDVFTSAAESGNLELIRFLHQHNVPCSYQAMDQAARAGHLHVVKFLHGHRTEGCSTDAMDGAAAGGFLDIVKFLHENRSEGLKHGVTDARKYGHMDVLKFFMENRPYDCRNVTVASVVEEVEFENDATSENHSYLHGRGEQENIML